MSDIYTHFHETCELLKADAAVTTSGRPKESPFYVVDARVPCNVKEHNGAESRVYGAERNTATGTAYLLPGVTLDSTYRIRWRGRTLDIVNPKPVYNEMAQVAFYACDWEERKGVG